MATANKNLSEYNKDQLPNAEAFRFGIIVSQWNQNITHGLLLGAKETLIDLGAKPTNIDVEEVPGAFELIYSASALCRTNKYDAIIVIGSVIRGETAHFDYVCQGVSHGIKDLNINQETPVIFCVLTDDNEQQSIDRSGGKYGNKGSEAGVAAVQMASFRKKISSI